MMTQNDFVRQMRPGNSAFYDTRSQWNRFHCDIPMIVLLLILSTVGLLVLFSASGQNISLVKSQLVRFGVGFIAMIALAQILPRFFERWAFLPYLGGILLLIMVPLFGIEKNGAQRWLSIGVQFQPSEIIKVSIPLLLASYLAKRSFPPSFKHVFFSLLFIAIPVGLVANQPDLGTAILIAIAGFSVLFLSGLPGRYLIFSSLSLAVVIPMGWLYVLHDYQKQRIITLFDPESDKLGAAWNIIQSTVAIGSGGFNGKGWGHGTQSQLNFLPESSTDFIIAVFAEEFGLFGVLLLVALYFALIARCLLISVRAQSMFGMLFAGSYTVLFFVYIFVNMGMVSGILPVVGVPLPFMSFGGTSVVTLMCGFGILMAISTEKNDMEKKRGG
jgi:rod shape determining protein RodA